MERRWTLNRTTHVKAQPPGGQIIGLSPGCVPKSLERDRAAFRQAPSSLDSPGPRVGNSHYAASLESFRCWSCRCCSPTCSSGASGRTSARREQQRGSEPGRHIAHSALVPSEQQYKWQKRCVCLNTTFRLFHTLRNKINSHFNSLVTPPPGLMSTFLFLFWLYTEKGKKKKWKLGILKINQQLSRLQFNKTQYSILYLNACLY